MEKQQFDNMMWWIDTMAIQTVKQYRRWMDEKDGAAQEEHWERLMGRMREIAEAINLIGRSKYATEETRAKIEKTVEWLNGNLEKHQIRINMRG